MSAGPGAAHALSARARSSPPLRYARRRGELCLAESNVSAADRDIPLCRWMTVETDDLHGRLLALLRRSHAAAHRAAEGEAPWPGYGARVPPEIRDIHLGLSDAARADTLLFLGSARKTPIPLRSARRLFLFMAGCALAGGAAASGAEPAAAAVIYGLGAVLLVLAALLWLPARRGKRDEWLILHEGGMAMVGPRLTGELSWEEVSKVAGYRACGLLGDAGAASLTGEWFAAETTDGARVPVPDIYDAPIQFIREAVVALHERSSQRKA